MKEYCATEKNGDIWYVQTDGVLKYCPEKDEWIVDVPEGKSVWQDKEPSKYWVINREEVPKIETFEQFKSKLQK